MREPVKLTEAQLRELKFIVKSNSLTNGSQWATRNALIRMGLIEDSHKNWQVATPAGRAALAAQGRTK